MIDNYEGNFCLFDYDSAKENSWVVKDGLRMKNHTGYFLPKFNGVSFLITQGVPGKDGVEPNPVVHFIDW